MVSKDQVRKDHGKAGINTDTFMTNLMNSSIGRTTATYASASTIGSVSH